MVPSTSPILPNATIAFTIFGTLSGSMITAESVSGHIGTFPVSSQVPSGSATNVKTAPHFTGTSFTVASCLLGTCTFSSIGLNDAISIAGSSTILLVNASLTPGACNGLSGPPIDCCGGNGGGTYTGVFTLGTVSYRIFLCGHFNQASAVNATIEYNVTDVQPFSASSQTGSFIQNTTTGYVIPITGLQSAGQTSPGTSLTTDNSIIANPEPLNPRISVLWSNGGVALSLGASTDVNVTSGTVIINSAAGHDVIFFGQSLSRNANMTNESLAATSATAVAPTSSVCTFTDAILKAASTTVTLVSNVATSTATGVFGASSVITRVVHNSASFGSSASSGLIKSASSATTTFFGCS